MLSAFLVEGSMDTWSGLYLRVELGATAGVAALVFIAFSTAVFLGRLFAGRVLFGLGPRAHDPGGGLRLGDRRRDRGAHRAAPWSSRCAFLLLGFTLSAAAPAAFGLVESTDEDPTNAIAAVTTVGYTGFIWSPPLLGWVADTLQPARRDDRDRGRHARDHRRAACWRPSVVVRR